MEIQYHLYTAENRNELPQSVESDDDGLVRYEASHTAQRAKKIENGKLVRVEVVEYCALFINPERLAIPEREYLESKYKLAVWRIPFRPTEPLTREDCNTQDGRVKLFSWIYGYPSIYNGTFRKDVNELINQTEAKSVWGEKFGVGENGSLFEIPENVKDLYSGLFDETFMMGTPPPFRDFHVDMALTYDTGVEITSREQFEQLALATYPAEHIDALLKKYDAIQYCVDNIWATYELFRTERFESIADCKPTAKIAAIRNYFSTFRMYGRKSKLKNPNPIFQYSKPKYVIANTAKVLGIPEDILAASKKTIRFDPEQPKEQTTTPKQATERKVGRVAAAERLQRTNYGRQLNMFNDNVGEYFKEWKDGKVALEKQDIFDMATNDTRDRKLQNEILYDITSRPEFDAEVMTQRVAAIQTKEDYLECIKETIYYIDATDIVRNIYGDEVLRRTHKKVSDSTELQTVEDKKNDAFKEFEMRFRGMKNEAFLFDIESNEPPTTKRGRPKKQQLAVIAPRFTWHGWVGEQHDGKVGIWCMVGVNPIFFANIANRYDVLTPEYMQFNRAYRNDDNITPAVEKVLRRVYEQRFPAADVAVRKALAKVKKEGERMSREDISNIRNDQFNIELSKADFQDAVISNAGIATPSKSYEWKRVRDKIDRALGLMVKYDVLIYDYSTHTNDDGEQVWKINFKAPQPKK